jgi:hypothetical protein
MYRIHATKKLLDRVQDSTALTGCAPTTALGNWYATVLFWKPQVALLVNEKTLLPVLMPLAPASDLEMRFPQRLSEVLLAHGVAQPFIESEIAQMREVQYAKTNNRSVVGVMNQLSYMAHNYRDYLQTNDLLLLSLRLSETPCGPLYKSFITPANALKAASTDACDPIFHLA